jgi:hypothetical protein
MRHRCNNQVLRVLALTALVAVTASAVPPTTDYTSDWILDGDFAYGMIRPEAASSGNARKIVWAGDGSTLYIIRNERTSDSHLLEDQENDITIISAWNRKTGREKEVYRLQGGFPYEFDVTAIGSTPEVLIQTPKTAMLADSSGRLLSLATPPEGFDLMGVVGSPNPNHIVLLYRSERRFAAAPTTGPVQQEPNEFIRVLQPNGSLEASGLAPTGMWSMTWSPEGWPVYEAMRNPKRPQPVAKVILRSGNEFVPYDGLSAAVEFTGHEPLRVTEGHLDSGDKQVSIKAAWLDSTTKSDEMHALVCADVEGRVELSPTYDAVAYIEHGVPTVRRIIKLPKQAFLTALAGEVKAKAMSAAKQNVLAIMMYGGDYDDALPLNGSFQDAVDPYMKNPALLKQFTYTYGGGPLPKGADPSKFELGFVSTDGGRAVAYGDGHVKWFPNP